LEVYHQEYRCSSLTCNETADTSLPSVVRVISCVNCWKALQTALRHQEFANDLVGNFGISVVGIFRVPAVVNVFRIAHRDGDRQKSAAIVVCRASHNMEVMYLSEEVTCPCMPLHRSYQMVEQIVDVVKPRVVFRPEVKCLEAAAILSHTCRHDMHQRLAENGVDLEVVVVGCKTVA